MVIHVVLDDHAWAGVESRTLSWCSLTALLEFTIFAEDSSNLLCIDRKTMSHLNYENAYTCGQSSDK